MANSDVGCSSIGPISSAETQLLEFLRERDCPCPKCGYNLRNLSRAVCPECEEHLVLQVGLRDPQMHWPLILTLAPSVFCLIAIGAFLVVTLLRGFPSLAIEGALIMTFVALSAVAAVVLATWNRRFLKLSLEIQLLWVVITWFIHLAVFTAFALSL